MIFKKVGVKTTHCILYTHTAEFLVHPLNTDIDTLSLSPVSSHKCINTRSGQGKVFQVCKPEITVLGSQAVLYIQQATQSVA